jgi:hypothetical protein
MDRFWSKVEKTEICWNWMGALCSSGYGNFITSDRRWSGAHRLSWEWANGPIPAGLCVLHRCDNRKCVRPEHLFLGSEGDNTNDMVAKGRANFGGGRKTHCQRGHAFTPENTILQKSTGYRSCRACNNLGAKARRERMRVSA